MHNNPYDPLPLHAISDMAMPQATESITTFTSDSVPMPTTPTAPMLPPQPGLQLRPNSATSSPKSPSKGSHSRKSGKSEGITHQLGPLFKSRRDSAPGLPIKASYSPKYPMNLMRVPTSHVPQGADSVLLCGGMSLVGVPDASAPEFRLVNETVSSTNKTKYDGNLKLVKYNLVGETFVRTDEEYCTATVRKALVLPEVEDISIPAALKRTCAAEMWSQYLTSGSAAVEVSLVVNRICPLLDIPEIKKLVSFNGYIYFKRWLSFSCYCMNTNRSWDQEILTTWSEMKFIHGWISPRLEENCNVIFIVCTEDNNGIYNIVSKHTNAEPCTRHLSYKWPTDSGYWSEPEPQGALDTTTNAPAPTGTPTWVHIPQSPGSQGPKGWYIVPQAGAVPQLFNALTDLVHAECAHFGLTPLLRR